jgi:hypothetical protein
VALRGPSRRGADGGTGSDDRGRSLQRRADEAHDRRRGRPRREPGRAGHAVVRVGPPAGRERREAAPHDHGDREEPARRRCSRCRRTSGAWRTAGSASSGADAVASAPLRTRGRPRESDREARSPPASLEARRAATLRSRWAPGAPPTSSTRPTRAPRPRSSGKR